VTPVATQEKIGLHNLKPAPGSHRDRKRLGRGPGSGTGKTAGKGHKGSMARAGHGGPGGGKPGFEGGQMPLSRRIPKRGFNNTRFRTAYQIIGLDDLTRVEGTDVSPETLAKAGLVRLRVGPVKLLANGTVAQAYTIRGLKVSGAAREKIVAAGGRIEE
jgi:large subunit ribosomal protein L15